MNKSKVKRAIRQNLITKALDKAIDKGLKKAAEVGLHKNHDIALAIRVELKKVPLEIRWKGIKEK